MPRPILACFIALAASACALDSHHLTPEELVHIVDSPADVRVCLRLATLTPPAATVSGFRYIKDAMVQQTLALEGTHLYLRRITPDWLWVEGIVYDCRPGARRLREEVVIRANG
ncbi:hypothetical protein [Microvirga terricola]|uniref:Lipoprotein n=1 Tax=Microvirga terricola TaxID=2719797 RepID=A0ABX0VD72_9HYPH|nr:hypothetical protein [Microvirga terricola]NIX77784.1 hypothetical protein [Microvirga terricola]